MLDHQWRRVRDDGRPATAVVLAEAGTGKTRLLAAFAERAGAPVYWGRCLAYGENGAYAPVAELLTAAGSRAGRGRSASGDRRTAHDRRRARRRPRLRGRGSEEITQGELHWGIRRALELATDVPTILAFEDLHWAGPALVELIGRLEASDRPFLILGSARPEVADSHPSLVARSDRRLVMSLPPLTSAESETLVARAPRRRRASRPGSTRCSSRRRETRSSSRRPCTC